MEWTTIWLFVVAALAMLIIPGPAVFYIMARSINQGKRAGVISVLGVSLGGAVHVVAGALGVSAILMTSATAFTIVKYVGAAYLIYLGCKTLFNRNEAEAAETEEEAPAVNLKKILYQSALVEIMNPKTALFFLAFFPQFISPAAGSVPAQFIGLGILFLVLAFLSDGSYALLAAHIRKRMKGSKVGARLQNRITGWIYISLGVFSAFASPGKS
ncbi:LysE family translocator [Brevibacillus centrosporus]|uniref:Threonine/homoserine/homoserine lactone efflux protein n=1 Tax=Brevibacillus centrosporus TaxID=54910 RepID=A0A1I3LJA5_9BACL|nr:LysE family translocator [Brevibacillus centrosporus]MEC2131395.1 LysE family translocator [Brevibacillus centrosporus]MED4906921.1 LysE family translocator [Brevibacillus centrosporus]RNB72580.1 LysE family translocator [Brevibacillus centrosporus]SFI84821.1 Threonine/homoserine/homoserine lactone efflux protein [Brevibacillus centrosporus]GED31608.1 RhtB family transporter [Brevibacillus centrosporus]